MPFVRRIKSHAPDLTPLEHERGAGRQTQAGRNLARVIQTNWTKNRVIFGIVANAGRNVVLPGDITDFGRGILKNDTVSRTAGDQERIAFLENWRRVGPSELEPVPALIGGFLAPEITRAFVLKAFNRLERLAVGRIINPSLLHRIKTSLSKALKNLPGYVE